jgi:TolB-like protein/Tfp pilus assembly protein PilF
MHVETSQPAKAADLSATEPLDSWKEIARYLKRDVRTVRRWEREGLPVHRHMHKKQASVYAYKSEIDVWWSNGRSRLELPEAAAAHKRWRFRWLVAAGLAMLVLGLGLNMGGLRDELLGRPVAGEIGSIAVLPLKNLSADREQDYFAEGMTEALITQLGKISSLHVISHRSVLRYRDGTKSLPQIARELNVNAILEGTVLRIGDRVRITANLVQAAPERHLWAESFEFDQRDILALQGQVAREVASQIRIKLTPEERRRLTISRPVDPEAYEAYLLGRAYLYKGPTMSSLMRAKEYFDKAIEKDPGYAPAYASLAQLHSWPGGAWFLTRERTGYRDAYLQARELANKALRLDDTLADAHNALAMVKDVEWDFAGAEQDFRRAIELNPSYPVARISYAMHLYAMERFDEAVVQARRAQQLDPAAPFVNTWAGAAYIFAGRHEEGMTSLQKALELEPGHPNASLVLARTYVTKGMYEHAIAELEKALTFNPTQLLVVGALAHAYARAGNREKALQLVDELKRVLAERGNIPTFAFVTAYAGLGDKEQAFAWLERSYEERRPRMVWLNTDPWLDPLRSDPRFHDLVRRVGLPTKTAPRPR